MAPGNIKEMRGGCLTAKEERHRGQSTMFMLEPLEKRCKGDNVEYCVEDVQVDEGECVDAIYCCQECKQVCSGRSHVTDQRWGITHFRM